MEQAGLISATAGLERKLSPINYAKASKKERGAYNNHPTVKSLVLMKYLIRLVTSADGITLDPYCGSGTSLKTAIVDKFNTVRIDDDPKNIEIPNIRITETYIERTRI